MNAREVLRDTYQRHGVLTAEIVVEEARSEDAPLHTQFEWRDSVAAEKYRLVQARDLIRKFKITFSDNEDGTTNKIREYVSVQREDRRSYVPTAEAVQDPVTLAILQREAAREAAAFRQKYQHLADYRSLVMSMLEVDSEAV